MLHIPDAPAVLVMFLAMLALHAIADYPLQGDFLAKAKSRAAPIPGFPWWQAMSAHALIHAAAVSFVTGSLILGALEFAIHFATDDAKCRGRIGLNTDQAIHAACKAAWAIVAVYVFA